MNRLGCGGHLQYMSSLSKIKLPIVVVLLVVFLGGCCSVLPFIKCKPNNKVIINWAADGECNNGRTVQVAFIILGNKDRFASYPAKSIFRPGNTAGDTLAAYEELQIKNKEAVFANPLQHDSLTITIPETMDVSAPLYLGIIAHFSRPDPELPDRFVIPLAGQKLPIRVDVNISRNSLSGGVFRK